MITVDLQVATKHATVPEQKTFERWVCAALGAPDKNKEVSLRVVDESESRALNRGYRQQDTPTNVLSFTCEFPEGVDVPLLGDIVICAVVVEREAIEQGKKSESHWAHMVVHGTLHLLGYDHINDDEASEMEALETEILVSLGYAAPYLQSTEI